MSAAVERSWRPGHSTTVPAEVVAEKVTELREKYGACPPSALVDEARPESSPLHPLFQWDDTKAAEQYRVSQARRIIGSLKVVYHEMERMAPAFVHVRQMTGEGVVDGYIETELAMANSKMRAAVLADAKRQLKGLRTRYGLLEELASVWEELDRLDEAKA